MKMRCSTEGINSITSEKSQHSNQPRAELEFHRVLTPVLHLRGSLVMLQKASNRLCAMLYSAECVSSSNGQWDTPRENSEAQIVPSTRQMVSGPDKIVKSGYYLSVKGLLVISRGHLQG